MDKFTWPTGLRAWALLIAIGFCGICDQYFMTLALHYESAGPVSVTRALNIVLAFVWDILIFSVSFDWTSIMGACLVTSCVVILAMFKWKEENPQLFWRLRNKFCCCTSDKSDS